MVIAAENQNYLSDSGHLFYGFKAYLLDSDSDLYQIVFNNFIRNSRNTDVIV